MTFMEFVGCASLAYGPTIALLVFTILKDPVRCIVLLASAFFWLVSFILSSVFWYILPIENTLIIGVIIAVLFQEIFRYLLYSVLKLAEEGLRKVSPQINSSGLNENPGEVLSYVSGLGFGIMSGTFPFLNVLDALSGPGTIGMHGGYSYFALVSALLAFCFTLLNTFWSIIFFSAIERRNVFLLGWVICSHLIASCITVLNEKNLYLVTLGFTYAILLISGHLAFKTYSTCNRVSCWIFNRSHRYIPSSSQVVS